MVERLGLSWYPKWRWDGILISGGIAVKLWEWFVCFLRFLCSFSVGDGRQGHLEDAPYNAIHVGAATPALPDVVSCWLSSKTKEVDESPPEKHFVYLKLIFWMAEETSYFCAKILQVLKFYLDKQ